MVTEFAGVAFSLKGRFAQMWLTPRFALVRHFCLAIGLLIGVKDPAKPQLAALFATPPNHLAAGTGCFQGSLQAILGLGLIGTSHLEKPCQMDVSDGRSDGCINEVVQVSSVGGVRIAFCNATPAIFIAMGVHAKALLLLLLLLLLLGCHETWFFRCS